MPEIGTANKVKRRILMKRRKIFGGLLMVLAVFTSCSKSNDAEMSRLISGSVKISLYHDVVYKRDGTTIKAMSLSDESLEPVFVCSDSLCTHDNKGCPLFLGDNSSSMIVDSSESGANGMPVIYVAYHDMYYDAEENQVVNNGYAIKKYNMRTNTSLDLVSGYEEGISQLYLYQDTIYYLVGYYGSCHLESIGTNGDGHKVLDCDNEAFSVGNIVDGTLYYSDISGKLYKSDIDLSYSEFMMETACEFGGAMVSSQYIYYPDDIQIFDTIEGRDFRRCSVYRVPLADVSAEPELVLSDVLYQGFSPICPVGDTEFLYFKPEISYLGRSWYLDYKGERQDSDIFSINGGKEYKYHTDTGEEELAIHIPGYDILSYFAYGDGYYIIAAQEMMEVNPDISYPTVIETIIYDTRDRSFRILE